MNNLQTKHLVTGLTLLVAAIFIIWLIGGKLGKQGTVPPVITANNPMASSTQTSSTATATNMPATAAHGALAGNNSPDTAIGQYDERPNAAVPSASSAASNALQPLVSGCSLRFSFAPDSKIVSPGGVVTYRIVVYNGGDATCVNVSYSIYYSDNEAFMSATPKPTASDYYWSVGDFAPRRRFTAMVTTRQRSVTAPYEIADQACATGDNSQDVCPENLIFIGSGTARQSPSTISQPSSKAPSFSNEYGIWVWQSPMQMAPGYAEQMVSSLKANNFNAVYVTIDDYLDIAALPAGPDKDAKTQAYMKTLSNLVTLAHAGGIAVDVEGGAKDWDSPESDWKGFALIDFVAAYNKAYPQAKVRALQYDVEPYLLPAYQSDPASVLTGFVSFIDASAARMARVDAGFHVVIPHFYDDVQNWTPPITYGGRTEYAYNQLLDVLKQKPDSQIIVMAYRNFFSGDNGIQDIVITEITEASSGNYPTKVIVAQETGDVTPAYVTYRGLSRADLFGNLRLIEQTFGSYSAFGGVAVHYIDPFLELK